jgi:flagellar L-ring protein precursor FlgH
MTIWLPSGYAGPIPPRSRREHPALLFVLTCCVIVVTALTFLNGCSFIRPTVTPSPPPPEASAPPPAPRVTTTGSLWNENSEVARLYSDNKASRVGDIVTIRIVESATGAKSATTKTSKDSSSENTFKGAFSKFFGLPRDALGFLSPDASLKVDSKDSYAGSGATSRNDTLTASMTALVTEVYPNGNLRILGHREVVVNSERQTMELTGIIRPIDVDSKNSVLSTAIADAKISYAGFGVVDDKQHPGWLVRVMNWVWPF